MDARFDGLFGFVPANYVKIASSDNEKLDISSDDALSGFDEVQSRAESSSEEPLLLEDKILTPRSEDASSQPETPRSTSSGAEQETKGNFFNSIDPTVSKTALSKSATIGPKPPLSHLSGPQPFQNKGGSLQRGSLKSDSETMMTSESLSSAVFAVREAFGGQRILRPSVKALAISADDLKSTQSKLRPGTPEDAIGVSESTFEEKPIPFERGGSVKNITQLFGNQAVGSTPRKPLSSNASDESLPSPASSEGRRIGGAGSDDREREKDNRPPAPAVKPKPLIRKESSNVSGGHGLAGPPDLIASIKAAAVAKVVKDVTSGVREETNL